jgi:hypothetical protein
MGIISVFYSRLLMSDFCCNIVLFYPPINLSWMLADVGVTLNYLPNDTSLILHMNINAGKCNRYIMLGY